jgi:hypothetical protein
MALPSLRLESNQSSPLIQQSETGGCMRALALLIILATPLYASAQTLSVSRGNGGTVQTDLGSGIVLNKSSSLTREWITINDSRLPIQIDGAQGVTTKYESGRYRGDYVYSADFAATASEAVRAFEVRFIVLDVFGKHQRTLSAKRLVDIAPSARHVDAFKWNLFSETDASTAFYSVAYIASVRTESGRVLNADDKAVLAEMRKINQALTAEDIAPEKPERKPEA